MNHGDTESTEGPGRVVCHFSCGTSSAVACKLAIAHFAGKLPLVIFRIRLGGEDPDNERFTLDCERWLDYPITVVEPMKYKDHWEVIEGERFLKSPAGAKCTTMLKKLVGRAFWQENDIDIWGFRADEKKRFRNFQNNNPELTSVAPLIGANLLQMDCHSIVERAGIALPRRYGMGFKNNNCVGCVKGGKGYWNLIRKTDPDVFARMARLERELNYPCTGVFLDELDPVAGRYAAEPEIECGLFCYAAEAEADAGAEGGAAVPVASAGADMARL